MAMISSLSPESRTRLGPAAALFHSLGDPTRLAIVRRLSEGEARAVDLMTELGLAQSTVPKHPACLRTASWSTPGSRAASPSTHWLSRPAGRPRFRFAAGP